MEILSEFHDISDYHEQMNSLPEYCIRLGMLNSDNLNPAFFENFSEQPYFDEIDVDSEYDSEESDDECPPCEDVPSFLEDNFNFVQLFEK